MANIVASLPLMLAYPLALSTVTYALGHRVARQNRQLERLNRIDVLTGLPNRRHWDEVADGELARYLRSRRPAVAMLIDVDNVTEVKTRKRVVERKRWDVRGNDGGWGN